MNQINSALLEPPAPPAQQGKEPPGSPPDTPFAAVLDDHQARTAVAEGHSRAADEPDAGADRRDDDDAPAKPGAPDAAALAALLGGVPLPADAAVTVAAAASAEPEPVGGRVLSDPNPRTRVSDPGTCTLTATRPIGVPADATALPLRPPVPGAESAAAEGAAASSPSLPIGPGVARAEGSGAGLGAATPAAVVRATKLADVLQGATARAAAPESAATPQPATAAARAQGATDGERPAQAATPAVPATPTSAPATPAVPAHLAASSAAGETALPARGVGLEHAVETVRLALRASAERGVTHARISLTPRELGAIEVHLRQTADGLVARVVAEHAGAAQQLQQAGAELRRSLEQQGVTLLRLDIGASGEESANRRDAAFDAAGTFGDGERDRRRGDADPLGGLDGATDADAGSAVTTLQLPNGALVDVLA